MMVAPICTERLFAQVKGSANTIVTVVAKQELKPGDVLRRFKEETAQDEPRRGNNTVLIGLVAVGFRKLSINMGFFFHSMLFFSYVFVFCLCDDDSLYSFSCHVLYFVLNNNTCLLEACTSR